MLVIDTVTKQPVAVVSYMYYNQEGAYSLNIGGIFVKEEFRRKGLGRNIVKKLEQSFLLQSCKNINEKFIAVRVLPSNLASKQLFISLGFSYTYDVVQYMQFEKILWKR